MSFCHECGEEVAEIDIYCPFCGISLQSVFAGGTEDNSQSNPINIDKSEIAEPSGQIGSGENTATSQALEEEEIIKPIGNENETIVVKDIDKSLQNAEKPVESIDQNTDDYSNLVTEENVNLNTESVEIPLNLIGLKPTAGAKPVEQIEPDISSDSKDLLSDSEKKLDVEMEKAFDSVGESNESAESGGKESSGLVEKTIGNAKSDLENPSESDQPELTPTGEVPNFISSGPVTGSEQQPVESKPETPETNIDLINIENIDTLEVDSKTSEELQELKEHISIPVEETPVLDDEKTDDSIILNDPVEDSTFSEIEEKSIQPIISNESVDSNEEPVDRTDEIPETMESDTAEAGEVPISFDVPVKEDSSDYSEPFTSFEPEIPEQPVIEPDNSGELGDSIAKPDTELDIEDSQSERSQFDSVRIMESAEESVEVRSADSDQIPAQGELVENNQDISEKPVDDVSQKEDPEPPVSAAERKESRSFTTPIPGVPDTDGNKSKLKPLEEGTILNSRYEVVRKIGGGGMGAVYLASDKNLGGVLRAVKEMVQSYIEEAQQEKAVKDFKRESLLLTTLEHPAIPTIYDYFYDDKEARFYLVMKYINGGDLASRLRSAPEGRIDESSVVEWSIQVADVLDYLHQRQPPIVYRDLKPANIMIDGNTGRVMLIDFGIARWINKEEKGVTAVGTMGYAPPELFSGNVEPRSDIYSLGSTIFHLLTGADPQSNPLLIFDFQKNPRPRQINPQLSDQMERILMKTVEYNAEKRFASAEVLRKELEQHLENLKANRVTYGVKESPQSVTLSDEMVFCGFCGQSIVASDLFCAFCGAKQPIAQKGVHSEKYVSTLLTARLLVIGTNELEPPGFTIEKLENLVGRRDPMSNIFPEVDLSKFDPQTKISRRHARIWRDGNNYMVEDLGSSNGTVLIPVVNEAFRLPPNKPYVLTNGDKIKLGDTTLHFILG